MYPALFRSLLQTLRRIDRRHELGHTLERAGRSGFIALEGRYPALVAFEKLITAEKQTYDGLGSALRSYFDDTAKHEGYRVTVGRLAKPARAGSRGMRELHFELSRGFAKAFKCKTSNKNRKSTHDMIITSSREIKQS